MYSKFRKIKTIPQSKLNQQKFKMISSIQPIYNDIRVSQIFWNFSIKFFFAANPNSSLAMPFQSLCPRKRGLGRQNGSIWIFISFLWFFIADFPHRPRCWQHCPFLCGFCQSPEYGLRQTAFYLFARLRAGPRCGRTRCGRRVSRKIHL